MANKQDGISLKVLVDKEKNRVIFAECDNDFVDILFSFLTNPMGTIIRLASKHSLSARIGCMNNLYTSVESIDVQHFQNKVCRTMLLSPRNGAESHCMNLKLKIDDAEPRQFYICWSNECRTSKFKLLSCYREAICECGNEMYSEFSPPETAIPAADRVVFVKVTNRYIISDDLQVMVLCSATSFSLLSKSGVMDWSTIEEKTFNLAINEVLDLLVRALVSRTPLTETLLTHKPVPDQLNSVFHYQGRSAESLIKEEIMNHEERDICINLFVSKTKNMVCYAETKIDFVNLLFSFLTIPLGHIVKQVYGDRSLKGCINHLYQSIQDLDEQCFKSSEHKEILVSPRLAPGFNYENVLLGIEDASPPPYYYCWSRYMGGQPNSNGNLGGYEVGPIEMTVMNSKSHGKDGKRRGGFLRGMNLFTVTDNLIVKPVSPILGLSILNELKVPFSDIEERTVNVGKEEAMRLLLSSFVSESALTNAFIK
ncbi:hypothetical protein L484_006043 [Morus notabilis]|uniref:DUF674 family protein n=1 Tax=Morus notabilis TaxID=981085 RepID=W9QLK8_9ROSA|nr:uncharacterized protein LOC21389490 [Morus notabilis]EXB30493.1 hypothetical protein L484_006043 [Morus notabilis]